jgi:nicotinate-nucleotide adenylyltransferase
MPKGARYGIFGGTFDPVHIGHLILAEEALDKLRLEKVIWVLTPYSPLKDARQITAVQVRLRLLEAALQEDQRFSISHVDIDREPPHYAVDTLLALRAEYPDSQLVFLMGGDSLRDLPAWRDPLRLLELTDALGVMHRPGFELNLAELEAKLPGVQAKIQWINAPRLEIASSQIRMRIQSGHSFRYFLHPAVYKLICKLGLYQSAAI